MSRHVSKEEYDSLEWLNVYGQYTYHSEATIRGTVAGLTRLRDAIDAAIVAGEAKAVVMASDGEGYHIEVVRAALHAQLGENEYIYEAHGKLAADEARRAKEMGLRDPFGSYKRIEALAHPTDKEHGDGRG